MNNPLFRPPAEADSVILQIDEGCPWNRCTFCGMYKAIPFRKRSLDLIAFMIRQEAALNGDARRIFLADGDVMRRPFDELACILRLLAESFPRLARVSLYANGSSILTKSDAQLAMLRTLRLHTLYMGLESGDDTILQGCCKGETASAMVEAGRKAQAAGLRMSVMILLGLGGRERCQQHVAHTAEAINQMQPRLLSVLRVIPLPGTRLHTDTANGHFAMPTEYETVQELRALVEQLQVHGTVFRANHSSNIIPIEARLPQDKQTLLASLDNLIASGMLDRNSPGHLPAWL